MPYHLLGIELAPSGRLPLEQVVDPRIPHEQIGSAPTRLVEQMDRCPDAPQTGYYLALISVNPGSTSHA
jgi:hypothetical protein